MFQKKTAVALILVTVISLVFAGIASAQLDKLTEVASGAIGIGQGFTYSPPPGGEKHKTYYWVEFSTQPEGMNGNVKVYAEGKDIDAFPVSNKETRIYYLNSGFSLQYVDGTADRLMVSIRVAPYTVGPGGH